MRICDLEKKTFTIQSQRNKMLLSVGKYTFSISKIRTRPGCVFHSQLLLYYLNSIGRCDLFTVKVYNSCELKTQKIGFNP